MSYCVAGVDVHKRMLAVAVADVEVEGEWRFERRQFGTSPTSLRELAAWLVECATSRKWSWNLPRNIGDQCGRPWSGTGNRRGAPAWQER
jgi:hypothetical protein